MSRATKVSARRIKNRQDALARARAALRLCANVPAAPSLPNENSPPRAMEAWLVGYGAAVGGFSQDPLDYFPHGRCRDVDRRAFRDGLRARQQLEQLDLFQEALSRAGLA